MTQGTMIIHVRFFNDGSVAEIGERPSGLSAQAWFDKLTTAYADRYQTYSGGRGVFRLEPADLAKMTEQPPQLAMV